VGWTIEHVQEADVEPAAVFALYADPATWNRWGHNATWARADGPLVEGGIVDVRANYGTVYHCRIRRLEANRALELVVKPAGLTIVNVYQVAPAAGGSRIRHAFEISGPISGLVRPFLAGVYTRLLEKEVRDVARMAADPNDPRLRRGEPAPVTRPERLWHRAGKAMRGGREEQRG
jgi:Polyketide cyclase / dehydrase and lipid transport